VQPCVMILYCVYTVLLENYGPLYRTSDRANLFPFGQLGTTSIPEGVLHLFGTISSSYSTVIFDCYFLLPFGSHLLFIIIGVCLVASALIRHVSIQFDVDYKYLY
jgi:hypothetical protein